MKLKIYTLLVLLWFGLHCFINGTNSSFDNFYLIDTSDFYQLTSQERKLLMETLPTIHQAGHDTIKIRLINSMYENFNDNDVWIKYSELMNNIIESKLFSKNFPKKYLEFKAVYYNDKGYYFDFKGDAKSALENYHHALIVLKDGQNREGMSITLNNLGVVYNSQNEHEIALNNFQNSLQIQLEFDNKFGVSECLNHIGITYRMIGNLDESIKYHLKALRIRKEEGNNNRIAQSLNNLGAVYKEQNKFALALKNFTKALEVYQELHNETNMAACLNNIGNIQMAIGDFDKAHISLIKGLELSKKVGSPLWIAYNSYNLYVLFKQTNTWKKALEMYKVYIQMSDLIKNDETQKATIRQQTQYEIEKNQLIKDQQEEENARILSEQIHRRDNLQYSIIFIGILLIFGLVLSLGFISISPILAEGLIFFAFLLFFEFLLIFSDPLVEKLTDGEPIYKLLLNAFLAGLIFPTHSLFERILKKRLIDNNTLNQ